MRKRMKVLLAIWHIAAITMLVDVVTAHSGARARNGEPCPDMMCEGSVCISNWGGQTYCNEYASGLCRTQQCPFP